MEEKNLTGMQNHAATDDSRKPDKANELDQDTLSKVSGGYPVFRSFPISEEKKKKKLP